MKTHIHKDHVKLLVCSLIFLLLFVACVINEGWTDTNMYAIIFCSLSVSAALFLMWHHRHDATIELNIHKVIKLVITEDAILFPKGYYFRQSTIYKTRRIPARIISELNIGTFPPTAIINNNEVIFLDAAQKDELITFAHRNNIPVVDKADLWSWILEPFLDTEVPPADDLRYIDLLQKNGISPGETKAIRKRIKWTMLAHTYATWEWMHYGHFDYLLASFRTRKKYWWSMEIALPNYRPNKQL